MPVIEFIKNSSRLKIKIEISIKFMSNSITIFIPNLKATNIITIKTINKETSNVVPAMKYNLSSLLKKNAMEQPIDIKCSGKIKFDDEMFSLRIGYQKNFFNKSSRNCQIKSYDPA